MQCEVCVAFAAAMSNRGEHSKNMLPKKNKLALHTSRVQRYIRARLLIYPLYPYLSDFFVFKQNVSLSCFLQRSFEFECGDIFSLFGCSVSFPSRLALVGPGRPPIDQITVFHISSSYSVCKATYKLAFMKMVLCIPIYKLFIIFVYRAYLKLFVKVIKV